MVCVSALGDEPYWMRKPARLLSVEPSVFWVGGVHDSVALPLVDGCVTVIENVGSEAVPTLASLTAITMPECTPALAGVPESLPVVVLKVAQDGLFWML